MRRWRFAALLAFAGVAIGVVTALTMTGALDYDPDE